MKLPTLWTLGKAEVGRVRERRREEERRSERRRSEKKEEAGARKGRKVAIPPVVSNGLWLRRVLARSCGEAAHFQVKICNTHHVRITFVARSTFHDGSTFGLVVFEAIARARRQEGKRARGQESNRAREQEGKRAREQESKRARGQESKRARGQKARGHQGKRSYEMRRYEDEKI